LERTGARRRYFFLAGNLAITSTAGCFHLLDGGFFDWFVALSAVSDTVTGKHSY
jgi:hypothetical protein